MKKRYKLRLKRLDFVSGVDAGAQGAISNVALLKGAEGETVCQVVKTIEPLGLVFGWCMATTLDGGVTPHVDLQGDAITGDDDLIKIAAQFMESGAASDVMHDGDTDGRIVFAMPLVPEVNKALGIESNVHGLAIAMKPSAETFKRFVSKELNAFSIAGIGEREPLETTTSKAAVAIAKKQHLLTATDGHTHLLDDCGGAESGHTSGESLPHVSGYDNYGRYHSHAWVRNGKTITIGMSEGHTHEIPTTIDKSATPSDVNSPPSNAARSVVSMLTTAQLMKSMSSLTAEHLAHMKTLDESDRESFVTKSVAEREVIVKTAESVDPIEVTMADGTQIRKSAGPVAISMAKQAKAMAETIAAQTVAIEKAKDETQQVTLEKRAAAELGSFAKSVSVKAAILKAVDGIADEAVRKEAHEALKSANVAMTELSKSKGINPSTTEDGGTQSFATPEAATEALEKGLQTFCKSAGITKNLWTDGLDAFKATPEGAALKAAYDESLAG